MDLLDELGPQLRALTADQPAQPGDRVPGVTRRARGIRRTRVAVGATIAVLALGVPAALVSTAGHHKATQYADLTSWPDRTPPQYVGLGDGVLQALADAGTTATDVHWLYRGRVEVPDHNPTYVALLTAEIAGKKTLVSALTVGQEVDEHGLRNEDGTLKAVWDTNDQVALKDGAALDHVGLYLSYFTGERGHAFGVVLGRPDDHTLEWSARPIPYAPPTRDVLIQPVTSADGVFLFALGTLPGPVDITLDGRESGALASGTSLPTLVRPFVQAPESWSGTVSGGAFETSRSNALSWGAPGYGTLTAQDGVLIACYGGGTLTAKVISDVVPQGGSTVLASKNVTCDGTVQVVRDPDDHKDTRGATLTVEGDRFQSVRFVSGHPA